MKKIMVLLLLFASGCNMLNKSDGVSGQTNESEIPIVEASPTPEPTLSTDALEVVMREIGGIYDRLRNDMYSSVLNWKVDGEEKKLVGLGFEKTQLLGDEAFGNKYESVRQMFINNGFEADPNNVGNPNLGGQQDAFSNGKIACITSFGQETEANYEIFTAICAKLDNSDYEMSMAMSEDYAKEIAADSGCADTGSLTETAEYNQNSKTWWIDMEVEGKEGCNPACVINSDGTTEINWRCTGLIQE